MTPLSIVARDIVQVGSVCGYDYTASSADDLLRNIEHALQWCELDYTTRLRLEGYVEELRGGPRNSNRFDSERDYQPPEGMLARAFRAITSGSALAWSALFVLLMYAVRFRNSNGVHLPNVDPMVDPVVDSAQVSDLDTETRNPGILSSIMSPMQNSKGAAAAEGSRKSPKRPRAQTASEEKALKAFEKKMIVLAQSGVSLTEWNAEFDKAPIKHRAFMDQAKVRQALSDGRARRELTALLSARNADKSAVEKRVDALLAQAKKKGETVHDVLEVAKLKKAEKQKAAAKQKPSEARAEQPVPADDQGFTADPNLDVGFFGQRLTNVLKAVAKGEINKVATVRTWSPLATKESKADTLQTFVPYSSTKPEDTVTHNVNGVVEVLNNNGQRLGYIDKKQEFHAYLWDKEVPKVTDGVFTFVFGEDSKDLIGSVDKNGKLTVTNMELYVKHLGLKAKTPDLKEKLLYKAKEGVGRMKDKEQVLVFNPNEFYPGIGQSWFDFRSRTNKLVGFTDSKDKFYAYVHSPDDPTIIVGYVDEAGNFTKEVNKDHNSKEYLMGIKGRHYTDITRWQFLHNIFAAGMGNLDSQSRRALAQLEVVTRDGANPFRALGFTSRKRFVVKVVKNARPPAPRPSEVLLSALEALQADALLSSERALSREHKAVTLAVAQTLAKCGVPPSPSFARNVVALAALRLRDPPCAAPLKLSYTIEFR